MLSSSELPLPLEELRILLLSGIQVADHVLVQELLDFCSCVLLLSKRVKQLTSIVSSFVAILALDQLQVELAL